MPFTPFSSFSTLPPQPLLVSFFFNQLLAATCIQLHKTVSILAFAFPETSLFSCSRPAVGMNQLSLIRTANSRRRRLKIRRLKYTCQANAQHVTIAGGEKGGTAEAELSYREVHEAKECAAEISLSLTSSSRKNDEKDGPVLSYGFASVIGRRSEMEDAVRVESGFVRLEAGEEYDFYGVYDGHGGARVAEACKERLHRVLEEEVVAEGMRGKEGNVEWEKAMENCFMRMDEEVVKDKMMGSTAVVAVVGKEEVVVANCGDSRAVLCRAGVAVPLSRDHKPDRPDELERVEAAGGRVINWNGYRVLGVLATSRSIGDQFLKPFVISKPEVTLNKRSEDDEFLILASDGLWDVISNEVACLVGRRCLSGRMRRKSQGVVGESSRAAEAAAVLADLAVARGSQDNISVIVVELKKID